ncbi:BRCA2, DNA repair associated [Arctopsyche grandis]|uniref:BRCA2, DNA repair associated n=1 Tax=Arctopsyche grandis TaxID=121162 RepID=UPI00406D69B8
MAKNPIGKFDSNTDDENFVLLNSTIFDEHSGFKDVLKSAKEKKSKLNSIIYKNNESIQNSTVPNVDFVLGQISHSVNLLESSQPACSGLKKKEIVTSKDFLPFSEMKECVSHVQTPEVVNTSTSESQWECNSQLFQLADNADALISIIDSENVYQTNIDSEKLFEGETPPDFFAASNDRNNSPSDSNLKAEFIPTDVDSAFDLNSNNAHTNSIKKRKLTDLNIDSSKEYHIKIDSEVHDSGCKRYKESPITVVNTNTKDKIHTDVTVSFEDTKDDCPTSPIIQTQMFKSKKLVKKIPPSKRRKQNYSEIEDSIEISKMSFSKAFPDINVFSGDDDNNVGFITASNKKIKVSSEAVLKSKNIFDGIENELDGIDFNSDTDFDASNKMSNNKTDRKSYISSSEMQTKDEGRHTERIPQVSASTSDRFCDFVTASNKVINVSNEALLKVNNIFNDINMELDSIDGDDGKNNFEFSGFTTASNKHVKISDDALKKANHVIRKPNEMTSKSIDLTETVCGFTTANNKIITISEDALKKARNLFDECQKDNIELSGMEMSNKPKIESRQLKNSFTGFTTASNKNIAICENSLKKARAIFEQCQDLNDVGFKASDDAFCSFKNTTISENVLKKAKNQFDECQNINTNGELNDFKNTFCGFTTANNKRIAISSDAFNKVKNLFDECQTDDLPFEHELNEELKSTKKAFCGFTTASNKSIAVSEDALTNARNLLNDCQGDGIIIDTTIPNKRRKDLTKTLGGFTTPSNKGIEVSKDASKKFQNNDPFFGFTTASNKNIAISEDALKKTRNLFDGCDVDDALFDEKRAGEAERVSKDSNSAFITANNKTVEVSEDALTKVKNLFDEFENDDMFYDTNCGFTTANNKSIKISDGAIEKAKSLFEDAKCKLDSEIDISKISNKNSASCMNVVYSVPSLKALAIKGIMNGTILVAETEKDYDLDADEIIESTSALLNDENNLGKSNTDEIQYPLSPILVIKKTSRKKKVFKVPYKKTEIIPLVEIESNPNQIVKVISLNQPVGVANQTKLGMLLDAKTNRGANRISLKDLTTCKATGIEDEILDVTPQNYSTFEFRSRRLDVTAEKTFYTTQDVVDLFVNHEDIDGKLVPDGWVSNHVKWILWKLASYERMYPTLARSEPILSVSNVLKQLKYRYDRELYRAERPVLRKILEKDEVPGKRMVLCVSNIMPLSGEKNDGLDKSRYELELTDGWYDVMTTIDPVLSAMIDQKKIVVGTKLIMYGAELMNCPQGVAPLEDKDGVRLKIGANSCRRCASWLKLGLYSKGHNRPLPLKLKNCRPGGGPLPNVRLIPINVYPMLHLNKQPDGSLVMKSDKLQQIQNAKAEAELQIRIEQLYSRVEKEFADKELNNVKKLKRLKRCKNKISDSPEDLFDEYESAADPLEFLNALSQSQRIAIQEYNAEKQASIRREVDIRVRELMDELGLVKEQAVKVLKARIVSFEVDGPTLAILTIWRPSESTIDLFTEGICLDATNLTPTGVRSGELHLSAGKRSSFIEVSTKQATKLPTVDTLTNECTSLEDVYNTNFNPKHNEVHIVGVVINTIPQTMDSENTTSMQTVYLANERTTLIAVNFWGGVDKFGFGKILEKGAYLACSNLQHRSRSVMKRIRQLYVTELSNITRCPKQRYLQTALISLENNMKRVDVERHLSKCDEQLSCITTMLKENVRRTCEEYNLSGLDFDSTFIDRPLNRNNANSSMKGNLSSVLGENTVNFNASSPRVESRLKKLRAYGDPPPLSPIVLNTSRCVKKDFVPPLCINNSKEMVTSRKIVRKLNEDFKDMDCSPPLSLESE